MRSYIANVSVQLLVHIDDDLTKEIVQDEHLYDEADLVGEIVCERFVRGRSLSDVRNKFGLPSPCLKMQVDDFSVNIEE